MPWKPKFTAWHASSPFPSGTTCVKCREMQVPYGHWLRRLSTSQLHGISACRIRLNRSAKCSLIFTSSSKINTNGCDVSSTACFIARKWAAECPMFPNKSMSPLACFVTIPSSFADANICGPVMFTPSTREWPIPCSVRRAVMTSHLFVKFKRLITYTLKVSLNHTFAADSSSSKLGSVWAAGTIQPWCGTSHNARSSNGFMVTLSGLGTSPHFDNRHWSALHVWGASLTWHPPCFKFSQHQFVDSGFCEGGCGNAWHHFNQSSDMFKARGSGKGRYGIEALHTLVPKASPILSNSSSGVSSSPMYRSSRKWDTLWPRVGDNHKETTRKRATTEQTTQLTTTGLRNLPSATSADNTTPPRELP
mmetsp:Transcript_36060/g.95778  ORF Transcript_36060/g.95778 Transcript_36060/m.95778 type:complete len:363 (+) Transcript_36060:597-1685(+)